MAKIKHNNFLDTVDAVFNDAKKAGYYIYKQKGAVFRNQKKNEKWGQGSFPK